MKFLKSKVLVLSLLSLFISVGITYGAIAVFFPERVTVSNDKTDGKWIPEGISWLLSSKEAEVYPAAENTSESVNGKDALQSRYEKLYLCGIVPIKTVEVSVIDNMWVTPGGESIGINLKTKGVLAVGIAEFTSDGKKISPAKSSGVKTGDIFTKIDGKTITKAGELSEYIEKSKGEILIEGIRNNDKKTWKITPEKDDGDKKLKIGLWIRESVAGIGTVSFYSNDSFAALGHPISDIDTGGNVEESGGTICHSKVIGTQKGEKGNPGSLMGVFSGNDIGVITSNTSFGVYGKITEIPKTDKIKTAPKTEVRPGKASIRCDIGSGKAESFDIEIIRIASTGNTSKNMIIKVTDKKLLNKTGGIVQGMSGSPILQNGKLIGAVTHVFVNDPARGYGIFIENMLEEVMKVK